MRRKVLLFIIVSAFATLIGCNEINYEDEWSRSSPVAQDLISRFYDVFGEDPPRVLNVTIGEMKEVIERAIDEENFEIMEEFINGRPFRFVRGTPEQRERVAEYQQVFGEFMSMSVPRAITFGDLHDAIEQAFREESSKPVDDLFLNLLWQDIEMDNLVRKITGLDDLLTEYEQFFGYGSFHYATNKSIATLGEVWNAIEISLDEGYNDKTLEVLGVEQAALWKNTRRMEQLEADFQSAFEERFPNLLYRVVMEGCHEITEMRDITIDEVEDVIIQSIAENTNHILDALSQQEWIFLRGWIAEIRR